MPNKLVHYGILGMRWGTRRFQNRDGTLTKAGIKRYGESEETANALQRYDRRAEEKKSRKILEKRFGMKEDLGSSEVNEVANFYVDSKRREAVAFLGGIIGNRLMASYNTRKGKQFVDELVRSTQVEHADLSHAIFGIKLPWDENKVKRAANGRFAKQATAKTETVEKRSTKRTSPQTTKGDTVISDPFDSTEPLVKDTKKKEKKPVIELLFALAGGLPGWVLYKLIEAWESGQMSESEVRDAASDADTASLTRKIAIINQLLSAEIVKRDAQGEFTSLEDLPKKEVASFDEVVNETQFEYTDWEDPDKRVGNCTLSTFAYELQRRGYDVEALDLVNKMGTDFFIPSVNPAVVNEIQNYYAASDKVKRGAYSEDDRQFIREMEQDSTYAMYNATIDDVEAFTTVDEMASYIYQTPEEFPPKSRGFIEIKDHIFNYEVDDNGVVNFMDGQQGGAIGDLRSGEIHIETGTGAAADQILNSPGFILMRTDDKTINEDYLKYVRAQNDTVDALTEIRNALQYQVQTGKDYPIDADEVLMLQYYMDITDKLLAQTY